MLVDDETWAMAGRFSTTAGPVLKAFDPEIVKIATDGSNRVQRIAHHRSVGGQANYATQPKAAISRDGKFIAFTSNWGNQTGRMEVYVVEAKPASQADQQAPAVPRNVTVR
ncbi:MAG: hypothetical protein U0172_08860 [Nitrospiraceae bacterium]